MQKTVLLTILASFLTIPLWSQMWNGQDTLYGNEWINYDQTYFKIKVAEDGIYRLPYETLSNAGIPVGALQGSQYQLFYFGEEIPLYVTSNGALSSGDYLEFYGQKNRSQLDRHLFQNPDEEMLNPEYSLFTDTSAYFLTWVPEGTTTARYTEVANDLTDLPEAEAWYWGEEKVVYSNQLHKKYQNISGVAIYYSHFDGDGFASGLSTNFNIDVPISEIYEAGPAASVSLSLIGNDNVDGHHLLVTVEGQQLIDESFTGTQLRKYTFELPAVNLDPTINLQVLGTSGNADRYAIGNVNVRYPKTFSLGNANYHYLELPEGIGSRYLEIEGINGIAPTLYDLDQKIRIPGVLEDGKLKYKLPSATGARRLVLIKESGIQTVSSLTSVPFLNYAEQDAQFIILSNNQLFADENGDNWVQAYADYRSSAEGGSYTTTVVDVETLYDQFSYGLDRHPISVRNFAHYIKKNWSAPKYFFIIGKGREYRELRTASQLEAASDGDGILLVPTFGYPGSDNLMLADPWGRVPIFPLGRLSAISGGEVKIYLDKVMQSENTAGLSQTIEDKGWMKQVVHLGGGGNAGEQLTIKNSLANMANTIGESKFGGQVTPFYKTDSEPIQEVQSSAIFDRINEGVSIVTFFGHSSPGTFDFNIDNPDNYENEGKYPLMLSLGCYSGNFFTSSRGIGERFIFYKNKGALAFGASRGIGFISALYGFANNFYSLLGNEHYTQGIGDGLNACLENFSGNSSLSIGTLVEQFSLSGDPSIRLHPQPGPDYVVDINSVSFAPRVVNAQQDSFAITFDIINLGSNIPDSIYLEIKQQYPSGEEISHINRKIKAPANKSTFTFSLATGGKKAVGLNTVFVNVDSQNDVDELPSPQAELNNELVDASGKKGIPLFILDNSAIPVFPQEFGIVNSSEVVLKACTSDPLAPERKYILQLDTTELFNSAWKKEETISQVGGVIKWQPNINLTENTVYYWRVSPDSTSTDVGYVWANSSFIYLPGSSNGWNQSHYYQFAKDEFDDLVLTQDGLEFGVNGFYITIKNKVKEPGEAPSFVYNLEGPATSVRPWNYLEAGIAVVVGDAIDGSEWFNAPGGSYGSVNTGNNSRVFAFPTSTLDERETVINFLENVIPPKSYVYVFTVLKDTSFSFHPEQWSQDSLLLGKTLYSVLEEQGAALVRGMETVGSLPYNFVYQKDKLVLGEGIADAIDSQLITEVFIPVKKVQGSAYSTMIGPAKAWESLSWQYSGMDDEDADIATVSVYGVSESLMDTTLLVEALLGADTTLSFIEVDEYPYLFLKLFLKDESLRSPVDLLHWRVFYEGLPDLAVNPFSFFSFHQDTLQQGDTFDLKTAIENVSFYNMDSLLVKYTLTDEQNNIQISAEKREPVMAGDTLVLVHKFSTHDLSGSQNLLIEANPGNEQPELYHFNNFLQKEFFVQKDPFNPILEVTFDGIAILDGDLVSSKPEIFVSLRDENRFLLLSDTSSFDLYLKYPRESSTQRIYMDDPRITFIPATSADQNTAELIFKPQLDIDGQYELTVTASDATGNLAGKLDYKITFEVINKSMISHVINYPNPFSTATQFVYTLTGDTAPDFYQLQIMTISGRIVKEIDQSELGPLKVGTHKMDYVWDGTDEFGDRLANGVYLYRFNIKSNDKTFDRYDNGAGRYFEKDFGKLVILR